MLVIVGMAVSVVEGAVVMRAFGASFVEERPIPEGLHQLRIAQLGAAGALALATLLAAIPFPLAVFFSKLLKDNG